MMKTERKKPNHCRRSNSSQAHPSIYPLKEHYERGGRKDRGDIQGWELKQTIGGGGAENEREV